MIAANYTINLLCDCEACTAKQWGSPDFGEYIGDSWTECAKQARKDGWRISPCRVYATAPGHKIARRNAA